MARVRPFRAIRYARTGRDLTRVAAPPYDVVSPEQRERLLSADPANVVALELAEGPLDPAVPGNRYETAGRLWREWLDSGTLARDEQPAVYVLEQRYVHDGRPVSRRVLVTALGLEPFDAGIVLPHERTLPKALGDRFEVIKATAANLSPVFGLYSDAANVTGEVIAEAMQGEPLLTATDEDGVQSSVWAVTDPERIAALEAFFGPEPVFIADGHHRYTVALAHRDERRRQAEAAGEPADPDAGYEYVMMALANVDDPGLIVLPTHRVADAQSAFDPAAFDRALAEYFTLEVADPGSSLDALGRAADGVAFLVKTRADDAPRLARLRDDADLTALMPAGHSDPWRHLDVAVLQELVLDRLLGVHPDRPETLERLKFVKDAHEALAMVPPHDAAFVLNPTRMEQLRDVALAGDTMPQKSTYFYPKLPSGLLMREADAEPV